jgi:hypothetical protein
MNGMENVVEEPTSCLLLLLLLLRLKNAFE